MKKSVFTTLCLIFCAGTFLLQSCGNSSVEDKLINEGLELAELMHEKASNKSYISLLGSSPELESRILEFSKGDVSAPKEVYKITGNLSKFAEILMDISESEKSFHSKKLKNDFEKKMMSMVPTMLNIRNIDSTSVAAISLLSADSAFVCKGLEKNCIYIFTYDEAYPVAVSFRVEKDNSVYANSNFIYDSDFPSSIKDYFYSYSAVKIEKIR